MAARKRQTKKVGQPIRNPHLTKTEFKTIAFVSTLILAGITIVLDVKEPVVWAFLGTALGVVLGHSSK